MREGERYIERKREVKAVARSCWLVEGSNNELQAMASSLRQIDCWMGGLGGCHLWVGHSDPIGFWVGHSCSIDS